MLRTPDRGVGTSPSQLTSVHFEFLFANSSFQRSFSRFPSESIPPNKYRLFCIKHKQWPVLSLNTPSWLLLHSAVQLFPSRPFKYLACIGPLFTALKTIYFDNFSLDLRVLFVRVVGVDRSSLIR